MAEISAKRRSRKNRAVRVKQFCIVAIMCCASVLLDRNVTDNHPVSVPVLSMVPFVVLLLSIALMPFISAQWWERHYPKVSFLLAATAVLYYLATFRSGRMISTGSEYFSFMALIGSLFVVSGGILINIKGRSTPLDNTILLALGAVLSNVLGTTGSSMVLIRPYIRSNKYRLSAYHIVFFIFVVSNIGGMLTPIGDPPLFLGYLKGIPFFWLITRIWPIWALTMGFVLLIFYVVDRHNFKKLPFGLEHEVEEEGEEVRAGGLVNILFLVAILAAVFFPRPYREIMMVCSAWGSMLLTPTDIHKRNNFSFAPIKEVAILFAGIFATMTPALDWLEWNASAFGLDKPGQLYWASGALSSFLDNAPTYLSFLSTACGLHGLDSDSHSHVAALLGLLSQHEVGSLTSSLRAGFLPLSASSWKFVLAISAGSVMFGAITYIGNGPNFMVKSIAEHFRVKMPSFFGYMLKYSIPVLVPIFSLIWYLFFF